MAAAQGLMHDAPRHSIQLTGIYYSTVIHVRTFAFSSPCPASAPLAESFSSGEGMKEAGWPRGMMRRVECSRCIVVFFFEGSQADSKCRRQCRVTECRAWSLRPPGWSRLDILALLEKLRETLDA